MAKMLAQNLHWSSVSILTQVVPLSHSSTSNEDWAVLIFTQVYFLTPESHVRAHCLNNAHQYVYIIYMCALFFLAGSVGI